MTFEVEIDGCVRQVQIESVGAADAGGGRFVVVADGVSSQIDVRKTDLGLSIVDLSTGRSLDAAATPRTAGEWFVQLSQVAVSAVVDGRRYKRGGAAADTGTGEQRILAPMPGRIVRVMVAVGDEVAPKQGVAVIEAMKMENELSARRAGRVKEIAVAPGTSVEAGRLLLVIE